MSMSGGLVGLAGRLERRPGLLGAAKLANVVLAMAWGFVVTFVFVRLLPLSEFRAFLLLVASRTSPSPPSLASRPSPIAACAATASRERAVSGRRRSSPCSG